MWYAMSGAVTTEEVVVSALANFIRSRMRFLGKSQVDVAIGAGIKESTLSNILNPRKKSGATIPRPSTIRGLAKALETEGALLTALLGYPVGPVDADGRYEEIVRRLPGVPWLADRLPDLMELSEDEFRDLMQWVDFRRNQGNVNRPKPSGRGKG